LTISLVSSKCLHSYILYARVGLGCDLRVSGISFLNKAQGFLVMKGWWCLWQRRSFLTLL